MAEEYIERVFEFTNFFSEHSEWLDDIRIIQIGETCLDKHASIEEHMQICHEISYVLSGEGSFYCNGEKYDCKPGDVQIVSKGTKHRIQGSNDKYLHYIHFAFSLNENIPRELADFFDNCENMIFHDNGSLKNFFNVLVNEYYSAEMFSQIIKKNIALIILILVWRKCCIEKKSYLPDINNNIIGNTVYSITKYIGENISEKLTVNDIATRFAYSTSYISHLFKKKMGISLKEYIIISKIKYAESLLNEENLSLKEVAFLSGYESVQSFCKIFKKYRGITPGEIKKQKK